MRRLSGSVRLSRWIRWTLGSDGTRRACAKCGRSFPLTEEFFWRGTNFWGSWFQRSCKACSYEAERARRGRARLDPQPLRDWLWASAITPGESSHAWAIRVGLVPRTVYRILYESETLQRGGVDRICVALGDPGLAARLYPELGELGLVSVALGLAFGGPEGVYDSCVSGPQNTGVMDA